MTISFDRVADIYDDTRALPSEISNRITDTIVRLSNAAADTHFFEPGIGTGRIAIPLLQRGYSYTGVDISDKMMDKLRQKLEDVSGRLTLINADATNLPFEDNSFDCTLTAHVLHLIADWQQALAEIRRVLKPEGTYLYFHSPSGSVIPNKFEEQWEAILAQYNFHSSKRGATNEEVLQWLSEQAAELETVTVAQFQRVQTVAELLQKYRDRIYSTFWQIPEDIFSLAIRDLEAWTYRYYESEDISIPSEFKIEITAMRS